MGRRPVKRPGSLGADCAHCGGALPLLAIREGDPYCTNECCRQAHGVATLKLDSHASLRGLHRSYIEHGTVAVARSCRCQRCRAFMRQVKQFVEIPQ